MRVTGGSLRINTSLAKLLSRQHFFLIGQVFFNKIGKLKEIKHNRNGACLHLLKAGGLWMTVLISYSQDWRPLLLTISPIPSLLPPPIPFAPFYPLKISHTRPPTPTHPLTLFTLLIPPSPLHQRPPLTPSFSSVCYPWHTALITLYLESMIYCQPYYKCQSLCSKQRNSSRT